ncbi:MAG: SAM-dependent methyltransferase [Endozoicomonas sp.]
MAEPQIPNTGRILDVWLGGTHHYPADAAAAAAFDQIYGRFPEVFKTLRAFIGRAVNQVASTGINKFLVIGSGIPSQKNVHEVIPEARVLYSDFDEENIRMGKKILKDNCLCDYIYCDAADPDNLDQIIAHPLLQESGTGPLGVIIVGVSVFLDDQQLTGLLQGLYQHLIPGSYLCFDFDSMQLTNYPKAMAMLGDGFHPRTPEQFLSLLGEWQFDAESIKPVQSWGLAQPVTDIPVFMYGGVAARL